METGVNQECWGRYQYWSAGVLEYWRVGVLGPKTEKD